MVYKKQTKKNHNEYETVCRSCVWFSLNSNSETDWVFDRNIMLIASQNKQIYMNSVLYFHQFRTVQLQIQCYFYEVQLPPSSCVKTSLNIIILTCSNPMVYRYLPFSWCSLSTILCHLPYKIQQWYLTWISVKLLYRVCTMLLNIAQCQWTHVQVSYLINWTTRNCLHISRNKRKQIYLLLSVWVTQVFPNEFIFEMSLYRCSYVLKEA